MTEGLKAAYPMADQASWFERIRMGLKMLEQSWGYDRLLVYRPRVPRHYGPSHDDAD